MNFLDFISEASTENFWLKNRVFAFVGDENYPFLFINEFFSMLSRKKLLTASFNNDLIKIKDLQELYGALGQSFLGQNKFYFLGDIFSKFKKDKKHKELNDFLSDYKGPHHIAFYLKNTSNLNKKKVLAINFPNKVNLSIFNRFYKLFGIQLKEPKVLKRIFDRLDGLSLDQSIMLIRYLMLTGSQIESLDFDYLSAVFVEDSPSLNLLAQYFFEKKSKNFFNIWCNLEKSYPQVFWLNFWADKIFRAYFVVKLMNEGKVPQARSVAFRLPFTFLKKYWKSYSLKELSNYYTFIYENDFFLKLGSNFCFIDFFYLKHFNNN